VRRKEAVEQVDGVDFRLVSNCFRKVSQSDQQQQYEGDRCQERVERQRAGKKRYVVFISGLQGTADEAGG
jgi:hypothetical protein